MSPNKQVEAQERLETEDIDGKKKKKKSVGSHIWVRFQDPQTLS